MRRWTKDQMNERRLANFARSPEDWQRAAREHEERCAAFRSRAVVPDDDTDLQLFCLHARIVHLMEKLCMPLPRKAAAEKPGLSSTSSAHPGQTFAMFPELWAFLTQSTFEDGEKRLTGRLSLSFERGRLSLSLTDAQTGQYATLEGESIDDLLLGMETRLANETAPWRASKYPPRGRK